MSWMNRAGRNNYTGGTDNNYADRPGIGVVNNSTFLFRQNIKPEYSNIPAMTGQATLPAVTKFKPQDYQTPIGHWFLTQRTTSDRRPRPVGVF